jgi:hypothetical protein
MYELGRLSSREAAALAGVSRGEFLQLLRTKFSLLNASMSPALPSARCTNWPNDHV